jgi:hypothetical protein
MTAENRSIDLGQIIKELDFENIATGRRSATALAKDLFRSSVAQRGILLGEMVLCS